MNRIINFTIMKIVELGGLALVLYLCGFYFDFVSPIINGNPIALQWHWIVRGFFGFVFLGCSHTSIYPSSPADPIYLHPLQKTSFLSL